MNALKVNGIGKAYKRYPNKWSRIWEWVSRKTTHEKTWVLRDISFSIDPGEAVGIVGINGAGKSTLLKIITGTTQPTKGTLQIKGRIAALLELGMGFHPDFTGRQNVYMAGQLLGMKNHEISACMAAIENFAEIGDYIDRPVRMYSSGMQMRLAFSVATAIRPDILIVDEALAVGDTYFQHKSFNKIREFRELGTTLLIVSHDRNSIQTLCDRAILLEHGNVIKDGAPEEVMDFYNALIAEKENSTVEVKRLEDGRAQTTSGTGEARVLAIELKNSKDESVDFINVGENVKLKVLVQAHANLSSLVFGYMIKDRLGQPIFGTNTHHMGIRIENIEMNETMELTFEFQANLGIGSYSFTTGLHIADSHLEKNYEWRDLALMFNVININRQTFVGGSWLPPHFELQR